MSSRRRHRPGYPANVFNALDAGRRVGWAKYYAEVEYSQQLDTLCTIYRDRIETLVPEFLTLVDVVLRERNVEAFGRAWRIKALIDSYQAGRPIA